MTHSIYGSNRQSVFKTRLADGAILLEDLDQARAVTITNNAETVVRNMATVYPQQLGDRIIYRDTDGRWDELKRDGAAFLGFAPIDAQTRQKYNLVDRQ